MTTAVSPAVGATLEAPRKGGRPTTDPTTHRVPRTHSLSPDAAALVVTLAAELGLSRSAVVELAVRRLARDTRDLPRAVEAFAAFAAAVEEGER